MTPIELLKLAGFVALPFVGGILGSVATKSQINSWYRHLKKAPWNPPDWAFGAVWSVLYVCMGVSSWLVYRQVGMLCTLPLYLYAAQLVLNWSYSPLFFLAHQVGLGCLNILANLGLVVACGIVFYPICQLAALLWLPVVIWLLIALSLNYYIWLYNDVGVIGGSGAKGSLGQKWQPLPDEDSLIEA